MPTMKPDMEKSVPYSNVSPHLVLTLYASAIVSVIFYYVIGKTFFGSPLSFLDFFVFTSVLAITVVGAYQLFFWTQAHNVKFKARCYKIGFDDAIPHVPIFIWVYSLLYYLIIGLVAVTLKSLGQGLYFIFGGLVLLTVQCGIFYFFPSVVPPEWRKYRSKSSSQKFLKLVQKFDHGRNCMPSMHMSLVTYVSLLLFPTISYHSFIIILLMGASCLLVKQHTLLDLFPGIALGWLVYTIIL